jgi:hypothetical protein
MLERLDRVVLVIRQVVGVHHHKPSANALGGRRTVLMTSLPR